MFVASGNVPSNAEDRGVIVISSAIVGIVIATVVITLRFWARKISKAPLSWDDWLALAAVVSAPCWEAALAASFVKFKTGTGL